MPATTRRLCSFVSLVCSKHWPIRTVCIDSLTHYLECPLLWSLVFEASQFHVGFSSVDRRALSWHPIDLRLLVVAHILYHYLKFSIGYRVSNLMYYQGLGAFRNELFIAAKLAAAEVLN